jgi:hypothetical protein
MVTDIAVDLRKTRCRLTSFDSRGPTNFSEHDEELLGSLEVVTLEELCNYHLLKACELL